MSDTGDVHGVTMSAKEQRGSYTLFRKSLVGTSVETMSEEEAKNFNALYSQSLVGVSAKRQQFVVRISPGVIPDEELTVEEIHLLAHEIKKAYFEKYSHLEEEYNEKVNQALKFLPNSL